LNQISGFKFVGGMRMGEAREESPEKEPMQGIQKVMGFSGKGAGEV